MRNLRTRTKRIVPVLAFLLVFGLLSPAYAADSAEEEGKEGAQKPELEYLQLAPLTLPIIGDKGISQQVSLVVSLEMKFGNLDKVKAYQPKLADAYLQDLYGVLGAGHGLVNGSAVDIKMIKERLAMVTHKVLGPDMVKDVLLQVVQQRPL